MISIVLVVVITILLRRMLGIGRGKGLTLLLVVIGLSIFLPEWIGMHPISIPLFYLAFLSLLLPIYGMYWAARDEKWPWFWAILGTTFLGLGLIFSLIYLLRYRPRPGMERRCGDCDAVVSDSAKFCPECGSAFDDGLCPSCGTKTSEGANFCDECGTDLKAEA